MNKLFCLSILCAVLLSACSTLAPGADPVEVRAEQTEGVFADTADFFLHLEYDNIDFVRSNAPAVHQAAEWLRQPVVLGTNAWPRDIAMVQSFDAVRKAYKANRTADNRASLAAALSALEESLRQIQAYVSNLGTNAAIQQHGYASLKQSLAAHAPAAQPAVFSPLPLPK